VEDFEVWQSKRIILTIYIVIMGVLAVFPSGCSDSPENEAAQRLRETVSKALDTAGFKGDLQSADNSIKSAIRQANQAGIDTSPALLAAGNISFARARQNCQLLDSLKEPINTALNRIAQQAQKIIYLQIEQDRFEEILADTDAEIDQLDKLVNGQTGGINQQLGKAKAKLRRLQQDKASLQQQLEASQNSADSIQQQADAKLRQGQTAGGSRKIELENQAYDLLLTRKEYFLKIQGAADRIKSLESQIAIVKPLTSKLQTDLTETTSKVNNVKNSPQAAQFRDQLSDVQKQIDLYSSRIAQLTVELQKAQDSYTQKAEETNSFFEQAASNYKKVRTPAVRDIAGVSLAKCRFQTASVFAEQMQTQENTALRLQSIAEAAGEKTAAALIELGEKTAGSGSDYAQKAMDEFDGAIEAYVKLQDRFGSKTDEFACSITKSHILALYARMVLAEQLEKFDVAEEAMAKAEELMEKVANCDGNFSESVTARLIDGNIQYTPSMAFDSATYYEEMKKQFQQWKTLEGDEKKQEVIRLLATFEEMKEPRDLQEFERLIGPERQQLETELGKILKSEEEEEDIDESDPNSWNKW